MEKRNQLYEGKAKKVFATDDPNLVIVSYKDDATAFDGQKKGTISGKGAINNRMSNYLMRRLEKEGIPTHFVEELNDRETVVKAAMNQAISEHGLSLLRPSDGLLTHCNAGPLATSRYGTGLADGPFGLNDHLTLTVKGFLNGKALGSKSLKLVDGTHILEGWTEVDLSSFGDADALDFSLESTRPDLPLYCCLDDLMFHFVETY